MTARTNLAREDRGFNFAENGEDTNSGKSIEVPHLTPQVSIDAAFALIPPPSIGAGANVAEAQGGGTFDTPISLFDSVQFVAESSAFILSAPVAVTLASSLSCRIQTIVNSEVGGICWKIDTKASVGADSAFCGINGDNSTGVEITGNCDDVFVSISQMRITGDNCTGFNITSTSPTPIDIDLNTVVMDGDNAIFFDYDPVDIQDTCALEVSTVTAMDANSSGIMIRNGQIGVLAVLLEADEVAHVFDGGRLSIDCASIRGNIQVDNGGDTSLNVRLMIGDINVDVGGELNIICNDFIGSVVPSDPNDGRINGVINGERYGNWVISEDVVLSALSTAGQNPTALDTPLQIEFGAAQGTGGDPMQMDINGNITVNETGQYILRADLQVGRGGAGGVAWLFIRVLVDGIQIDNSIFFKLDGVNDDLPVEHIIPAIDLTAGEVITLEIVRDSQGVNEGSLMSETPTLGGWNSSPSARIIISRYL